MPKSLDYVPIKYGVIFYGNMAEKTVRSEMYHVTQCVISLDEYQNGKVVFPCGDGCDYKLNKQDIREINKYMKGV